MHLFLTLSLAFTFMLSGCTGERHDWTEFTVYDKAIEIDNYVFPSGAANQVFYKVKAQYPTKDVVDFYKATIKHPWIECNDSNNWQDFGDESGNEPLYIHQTSQRWINKGNNRFLLLAIKYRSQGSEFKNNPDNNIQNVYLVEYYLSNIKETLSESGEPCNGV